MESIIAQQRIARRRPLIRPALGRYPGSGGSQGARKAPAADFFLLEGGARRPYLPAASLKAPPSRRPESSLGLKKASARRGLRLGQGPLLGLPRASRRGPRLLAWLASLLALLPSLPGALLGLLGSPRSGAFRPGAALLRRGPSPSRKPRGPLPEEASPDLPGPASVEGEPEALRGRGGPGPARLLLPAAFGALILAGLILALGLAREPRFPLPEGGLVPGEASAGEALLAYLSPELAEPPEESFVPPAPRSLEIERYTVRAGDSLGAIARRAGLSVDSLVSMNGIASARGLRAGTELKIPNMDGLVHLVGRGESLGSIAQKYGAELTALADANDLGTALIRPGQSLFIPGARLPAAELKRVLGEFAVWPLRGALSSSFGYRPDPFTGVRRFHAGIDIVAPPGAPVLAAIEGRVADLGYNRIFGNYLILSHPEGMQSLYAHLSDFSVRRGQSVSQGSRLGSVGNTGYSTGPHLHFGLFKGNTPVNPLKYLK